MKDEPKAPPSQTKKKSPVQSSQRWSDNDDDDEFLDPKSGTDNDEDIDLDQLSLGDGAHQD